MALWTDIVDPATLTGFVRADLADYEANRNTLAAFLPNRTINDIIVRFSSGGAGLTDVAMYRAYDAETRIQSGPAAQRQTVELPPLGSKTRVSEYDRLRSIGADSPEAVLTSIERVAVQRARAVADRVEVARGAAIVSGAVSINENEFIATADFGRAAGHTVTAGTLWSAGSPTPLSDLASWTQTYIDANGQAPGAILMSTAGITALQRTADFRTSAVQLGGTLPGLISVDGVNGVLSGFGLPPIVRYDRTVRVAGSTQRVIPANRVILLPAQVGIDDSEGTDLGGTVWGRTLEAQEPNYNLTPSDQPGLVVGAYKDDDPLSVWVRSAAIALPILANPNLSFCATVL
jgi:hypothetical protein